LLTEDPRTAGSEAALEADLPIERENLWMAQVPASVAEEGDMIELPVRSESLRLFDPRSGDVIAH
jgi:hypothetical protein